MKYLSSMDNEKNGLEPKNLYNYAITETNDVDVPKDQDSGDMYRMGTIEVNIIMVDRWNMR
jgi:hypothetical protein